MSENSRSSLDIYYPDSTYSNYVVKDFNDQCGGICNYDNIGLSRPSYLELPNTDNNNLFNKYIWIENNNSSLLYLTFNHNEIGGYLKFNNDEIKKLLPNNVKLFLKKTIFIVPYLKKDLESSKLLTEKQIAYTNLLKNELIKIQQSRGIVNEKIFPDTQFNKFNYSEIQVEGILSKKGYK